MTGRARCVVFAVALALPGSAVSQPISTLEGIVTDEHGAITRAEVSVVEVATNVTRTSMTNDRGFFRLLDVVPGKYVVSARSLGHVSASRNVLLGIGERAHLDLVLRRAASTLEPVQVRDRAAGANSIERTSVSASVGAREIQSLPHNTRNVMELAAVAPGIRSFQPTAGHALPSAGALRDERAINLYIDGVEMKNLNSGNVSGSPQTGSPLPVDGIEELRVILNSYDPEFTRGASYVISAVSRRGTNKTQGSAFGFFQNRNLVSSNDFQRSIPNFEQADFRRRQAGASLRGPVIRDRLFYAANYELADTENYVAVVPGRPAGDPAYWDEYAGVFAAPNRNHTGLIRLTYVPSGENTFEAIWSSRYMTGESRFGGTVAHESAVSQRYAVNTVNLRHRWIPSPRLASETSLQFLGWSHEHAPINPGPSFQYPTIQILGDGRFEIHESQLRAVERLTFSTGSGPGSHLVKAGMEVSRVTAEQFAPNNGDGLFRFRSEKGDPFEALISVGLTSPDSDREAATGLTGWVLGGYLSDEWQIGRRLVLNLGLRYDAEINTLNNRHAVPWASDPVLASRPELRGLLSTGHRRDDLDNVSPRVSFSWDFSGRRQAFIRGGFGIMYDRIPGFVPFGERRAGTWRNYAFPNPGTVDPAELRRRVAAGGGAVPPSITLLPERMDVPENRQWSVGLGAQLTPGITLNVDYIDQDLRNIFASTNLNWLDISATPGRRVLDSAYGNIVAWGNNARARYNALLTNLTWDRDTMSRLSVSYTLASARADWDVENTPVPAAMAGSFYVMQRTSGDERHRVVLSGRWNPGAGFSLSTISTVASPRPYRAIAGRDVNSNNLLDDDWIDGSRYRLPPGSWSNWYRVVDLRVTKAIPIGRGARLSVIGEAFNVFNTQNYSGYFGVQQSASGQPRPDFGSPSGIFATRQLQLGSRVQF